jgi:serine/threonine protein kinase
VTSEKPDPLIGQHFGPGQRLRVERRLGKGGYGVVYLGHEDPPGRAVAIKFLHESGVDANMAERFEREGRKYGKMLRHPNLVRVYWYGTQRGRAFIVSEFVDGRTLADIVDSEGAFQVDDALRITKEIAIGLHAAHGVNVVHRDLKPGNVMVRASDGAVKILDFGVAKDLESIGMRTVGSIGTPGYSAPEQSDGRAIDHRADIFSLGAILYELLTGTLAFKGEGTVEIENAARNLDPIPPTELNVNVTRPVAALLMKMLEKSRRRRFADMAEVALSIDRIGEGTRHQLSEQERHGVRAWLRRFFER